MLRLFSFRFFLECFGWCRIRMKEKHRASAVAEIARLQSRREGSLGDNLEAQFYFRPVAEDISLLDLHVERLYFGNA